MEVAEDSTGAGAVEDFMGVVGEDSMGAEVVVSVEVAAAFLAEAVVFTAVAEEASAVEVAGTFAEVAVSAAGQPVLLE
jgi:hypothetical protein